MKDGNIEHYNSRNDTTEAVSLTPSLCVGIFTKYHRELCDRDKNDKTFKKGLEPRTTIKKFAKIIKHHKAHFDLIHEYKDDDKNYHNYCFVAPYDETKIKIINCSLHNKKIIGDRYTVAFSKHAIARMMYRLANTEIRKVIAKMYDAIQRYYNVNYLSVNKPPIDGEINIPVFRMGIIICESLGNFCVAKTFISRAQMSDQQIKDYAEKMAILSETDEFTKIQYDAI